MQNMWIWICITTLENVSKQWCTGYIVITLCSLCLGLHSLNWKCRVAHTEMQTQYISHKYDSPSKRTSIFTESTVIKPSTNIRLPYSPNQAPIETQFLPRSNHNVSVQSMARNSTLLWEYLNVLHTVHNVQKGALDTSIKITYCKVRLSIFEFFHLQKESISKSTSNNGSCSRYKRFWQNCRYHVLKYSFL